MNIDLKGDELHTILKFYEWYISRDFWPGQLTPAVVQGGISDRANKSEPVVCQYEAQALRIGGAFIRYPGSAQAHSVLYRTGEPEDIYDNWTAWLQENEPEVAMSKMPRSKRKRKSVNWIWLYSTGTKGNKNL